MRPLSKQPDELAQAGLPDYRDYISKFPNHWTLENFPQQNEFFPAAPRQLRRLQRWHAVLFAVCGIVCGYFGLSLQPDDPLAQDANMLAPIALLLLSPILIAAAFMTWKEEWWSRALSRGDILPAFVHEWPKQESAEFGFGLAGMLIPREFTLLEKYVVQKANDHKGRDEASCYYVKDGELLNFRLTAGKGFRLMPRNGQFWVAVSKNHIVVPLHNYAPPSWPDVEITAPIVNWLTAAVNKSIEDEYRKQNDDPQAAQQGRLDSKYGK